MMLRTLLALVLGLYLFIIGLVTFVGLKSIEQTHESGRIHIALCALRDNIQRSAQERETKIEHTEDYLRAHPHGAPGIPVHLIHQSIRDDRLALRALDRNVAALNVLKC